MSRDHEKAEIQKLMMRVAHELSGKLHDVVDPLSMPHALVAEAIAYEGPGALDGFVMAIGSGRYAEMLQAMIDVFRSNPTGFQSEN